MLSNSPPADLRLRSRVARAGLWLHLATVVCVSAAAYSGWLERYSGTLSLPGIDKVLHFVFVGGIAFWWTLGWRAPPISIGGKQLPRAVIIPLAVATIEELLQFFSPRRNADFLDWVADLSGLLIFWMLGRWLLHSGRETTSPR